jgi:hypothetical protein
MRNLVIALVFAPVVAAAGFAQAAGGEPQDELAAQAVRLASPRFAERQEATRILEAAGPAAIHALRKAAEGNDSEARQRAIDLLARQAFAAEHSWRAPSRTALAELQRSQNMHAARAAQDACREIERRIAAHVTAELTDFGAIVMPQREDQDNPAASVFNVQIGQGWRGGDERLALLTDLGMVPWLSLENSPVSDAGLVHVGKLTSLERLYLGSSRVRGDKLHELAGLSRLRYLSLKQLPLGDEALASLPELPALQDLGLDYTRVGDQGLAHLARYPLLSRLWLDHTKVTDAGMVHLAKLPNLKTLFLPGTETTGPGLAELRNLSSLSYLSLKEAKLKPESLKHIAQFQQLETLGLDQTNVTDDQLADLAPLSRLKILWLSKTEISDVGLKHLHDLASLQVVYLHGALATAEGVEDLRRALPECHVAR